MRMKTILVVDDNKLSLASARNVLNKEYRVIAVTKGEQALTYLEKGECDIALLDINMPDMDGFEVMKRIRDIERFRGIPVIFLTADNDGETETRCFKEGAADYITKPFVPDVMLSRIGRILELEELRRNLTVRLEQKTREVSDIKSKSHQDALTGLWDRAYTEEKVNDMLNQGTAGALLMIDIDNFKSVNDNYGHMAGDKTLAMLADTLREFFSDGDVICRLGGDEFVVFMKNVTLKAEASKHANDIISDFKAKIRECRFETNTSISVGIARAPEGGTNFNDLYNSADKALYFVKQNGKNSYHFFTDSLLADNNHDEQVVNLPYVQDLMRRTDNGGRPYFLDFDSFHHVYHFACRLAGQGGFHAQVLLFTADENKSEQPDEAETEFALEMLEKALCSSLRPSDVYARYSSKQLIVIVTDADSENGSQTAEHIMENYNRLYTGGKICVDYSIACMDNYRNVSEKI